MRVELRLRHVTAVLVRDLLRLGFAPGVRRVAAVGVDAPARGAVERGLAHHWTQTAPGDHQTVNQRGSQVDPTDGMK